MEQDIAFNPAQIYLLDANAVVLSAQLIAYPLKQFGRFFNGNKWGQHD